MTKKELLEIIKDVPDDFKIRLNVGHGLLYTIEVENRRKSQFKLIKQGKNNNKFKRKINAYKRTD